MTTARTAPPADLAPETVANVRGSSLLLVGRVSGLFVNGLTQVLVVRYLTKSDFGALAFAISVALLGHRVVSAGHGQVTPRFMALYHQQRDDARFLGVLVLASSVVVGMTTVLLLGLAVLRATWSGLSAGDAQVLTLVVIMFVLAATDSLDDLFENAFAVFGRPGSIFVRKYLLTPGALLAVSVAVITAHGSVQALAVGYVVTGIAGVGIYLALLVRILRENLLVDRRLRARVVVPAREVFGLGLPLVSTEVLNVVTNSMGFVALGVLAGTSGVADLRAVFPVAAMNQIVIYTFTTLFVPLVSRLHGQGDPGAVRTAYWQTAGWLAVLSFPVFALTGPFSHAVTVGLFGDRYAGSSAALALLSTGFYVNALFGFNAATLVVFGQVRRLMVLNLTCAALNAALYVLLIPWAGATGVAAAICVTVVVQNLLTQRGLCATIATPFLDPQFVPVLATVAATAGVAWAAAALLSPDLWEALVLSALGAVLVLWVNRRRLQLGQAFPELRRVPGVRRLVV